MTTVYVTHDQREALTMSDRIAVINAGRIMQLDVPRTIYEKPSNRFVAEFIGESTFLPVVALQGRVTLGGRALMTAKPTPADGKHLLMLRPERLRILGSTETDVEAVNILEATLLTVVYQGDSSLIQVELPGAGVISVRSPSNALSNHGLTTPGSTVRLGLNVQDTVLLDVQ
jgi:putative spermidine/putrescine transport system ATP-binding protein